MKKSTVLQLILAVLLWSIPIIISLVVVLVLLFPPQQKYFQIKQAEYIHLESYRWGYNLSNKPRYLGKHTEVDSDGNEKHFDVVALQGLWSKKYIGTSEISFLGGPVSGDVYMLKDAKDPIMFMDIEENHQAVTINEQEFSIEEIVGAIRNVEPEKYDKEKFENCLVEYCYIYLSVTKSNYIRVGCRLIYDNESDRYYVVRYDSLDECYYMHELTS